MRLHNVSLRLVPIAGAMVAALSCGMPDPALAQAGSANATSPAGQPASASQPAANEFSGAIQKLQDAQRSFQQAAAAQGTGQGDLRQARQKAQDALQEVDRTIQKIGAPQTAEARKAMQQLRQNLQEARTKVQDDQAQPQQVAQSLDELSASLRTVRRQVAQGPGTGNRSERTASADSAENKTRIHVQQPPAKVQVQERAPEVTVVQPQPKVIVKQPEPKVTVKQPEPQVSVDQGRPQVQVQQQGQPQVQVRQEKGAQVQVEKQAEGTGEAAGNAADRTGQAVGNAAEGADSAITGGDSQPQGGVASMTGDQLIGKDLKTTNGDTFGEVQDVVVSGDRLKAVLVDVGGFLGIGDKRVAIPTDRLSMRGQDVVVNMTKDEVNRLPEYNKNQ